MKAQVANNMMSSFLAFLDNRILDRGEAFTNHSSQLYELSQGVHGSYTIWGAPFKQMVCDASITDATKFTGVSINGNGPYGVNTSGIAFFQYFQNRRQLLGASLYPGDSTPLNQRGNARTRPVPLSGASTDMDSPPGERNPTICE